MRIAVLDLGTNIFNLLIVDKLKNKKWEFVTQHKKFVQLGEGGINQKYIIPCAIQRAIETLENFAEIIEEKQCNKIFGFATSAVRNAKNGKELIQKIYQKTRLKINIIDGNKEAELIYHGVHLIYPIPERALIMDIGGGSVEFILAEQEQILWKHSFEVGAQRLFYNFHKTDPIPPESLTALDGYLEIELKPLVEACQQYPPIELIGTAGTFEVIYEIFLAESNETYKRNKFETLVIPVDAFYRIHQKFEKLTLEERLAIKGMRPKRAGMVTVASALIAFIMKNIQPQKMRVSPSSLKEGCLNLFAEGKIQ